MTKNKLDIYEIRAEIERRLSPENRSGYRSRVGFSSDLLDHVDTVKCANGVTISIQASSTHYCSPRDNEGPWDTVEIGFPSKKIECLMPFAEDASAPTDTVYAQVPLRVAAYAVLKCGGFA